MDIIFIPIYYAYLTSRMIYKKYIFILLSFILLSFILFISRVDNSITSEDKEYIKSFIVSEKKSPNLLTYTEQLELIKLKLNDGFKNPDFLFFLRGEGVTK